MITELLSPDPRAIVEMLLAVSALIILVLFARKHVAREFGPGIAYALWLIPTARLVLPPLPNGMSWVSILGLAPNVTLNEFVREPAGPTAGLPMFVEAQNAGTFHTPMVMHGLPVEAPASLVTSVDMSAVLLTTLLCLWVAGTLFVLARNLAAQNSFMSVVRNEQTPASPRLQAIADQVARQVGLKRTPKIATSLVSNGPLVTGLLRPVVLLPAWFEADYEDAQQRAALAHELTHIKRGDLWALQLAELFVAVMWFNPLAYLARSAFRTDQEAACDSDVLRCGAASPHAYGSTLLKAVRMSVPERLPHAVSLPLTHSLKERMRLMTYPAPSKRRRLAGLGLTAILGSGALVATASVTASAGEPDKHLTSSIKIDNSTLFIDGEKVKDRQFVLLGEPFRPPTPEDDKEIRILSKRINDESKKLRVPPAMPPLPPMPPMPKMPDAPPAPALEGGEGHGKHVFFFSDNEADAEKSAAEWEAWADQFEAQTEEWQAVVDERMAEWESKYDSDVEAANLEIESRMEDWSTELEMRVEAIYGDGTSDHFDDLSTSLEELAVSCRDANLATGETRILSSKTGSGDAVHVACVQGDATRLKAPETLAAVQGSDLLCPDEKKMFSSRLTGNHKIEINKE